MLKSMLKAKIKEIIYTACLYFTIIVFSLHIFGGILSQKSVQMPLERLSLLFLFSIGMAVAGLVWQAKKIPVILRHLIHYASFILTFWGVFILIGDFAAKPSSKLTIMILASFFYILATAVCLGLKNFFRRQRKKKEAYSPVYNKPQ
ncbi:MAG: hypothetical protein GX303_08410 [Clostridiales bacterium]|nr:hypothetical protein [Clostridiales bacterium]